MPSAGTCALVRGFVRAATSKAADARRCLRLIGAGGRAFAADVHAVISFLLCSIAAARDRDGRKLARGYGLVAVDCNSAPRCMAHRTARPLVSRPEYPVDVLAHGARPAKHACSGCTWL